MSIDEIASEALRLPPRERALLAGSLWESLEDPSIIAAQLDDNAAIALAMERDHQIETGQVQAIPHEEMMARLRR
jgi:putative addiction module component (TIGR02574 family)